MSFLENLTSDSLGLSAEEFDRYMSGKSIPFASLQAGVMVSEVFAFFKKKKKKVKCLVDFVFSGFTSHVPKYVDTFRAETQADKSPTANTGTEKRYGNLQRKKDLILFGCLLETVFVIFFFLLKLT